jgi:hypothetical protein
LTLRQLRGPATPSTRTFNCGNIWATATCYQPGWCLGPSCADNHSFGWGSADEDVTSHLFVEMNATSPSTSDFIGTGYDYANACYSPPTGCDDQDSYTDFKMWVGHFYDSQYVTIYGHGLA